jgi:hypothetical protein
MLTDSRELGTDSQMCTIAICHQRGKEAKDEHFNAEKQSGRGAEKRLNAKRQRFRVLKS